MKELFMITATRSMKSYAQNVTEHLLKYKSFSGEDETINGVDALQVDRFADGEMEIGLNTSIRGKHAVIFCGSGRNEAGIPVEEAKMELYNTIDVMARSQAKKIIVFEPYVSCARSDRTTRRNSVSLWVHFKILTSLGVNQIVTYQLHSDKSKSMLDPVICVLDDIEAFNLLAKYLCDKYIKNKETLEGEVRKNWMFCSVDAGGETLARTFANSFGAELVVAHKQRNYSKPNSVESVNILSASPVKGKKLWIVDDMIDTGGSIERLVHALVKSDSIKPAEINIMVVHAPFSYPALERIKKMYDAGYLNRLIVTDTIYCSEEFKRALPKLEIVSSCELSSRIIRNIMTNSSMLEIRKSFNAAEYLNNKDLFG